MTIGTAGWSIPSADASGFPGPGTHLERFARQLSGAEINSSFHRRHRRATYERWAASVPPAFRFSAKVPKSITHTQRLVGTGALLEEFCSDIAGLGDRLEVLLVQLPPSLAFDRSVAKDFFLNLRGQAPYAVACEPRHFTWFTGEADDVMRDLRVARVAADPILFEGAERPGGWTGMTYYRLHGSPRRYYSSYDDAYLEALASSLQQGSIAGTPQWCIFDNTASGAAVPDALLLHRSVASLRPRSLPAKPGCGLPGSLPR